MSDYRRWLVPQIEQLEQPVDLVGHDGGGAPTVNVAMTRPDLLRGCCCDAIGAFDPDDVWHGLGQTWQTAGEGEAWVERS